MTTKMAVSSSAAGEAEPLVHAAFNSTVTHFVAATASGVLVFSCTLLKHEFCRSFVPSYLDGSQAISSAALAPSGTLVSAVFRLAAPDADADMGNRIEYWRHQRTEMLSEDIDFDDVN